MRLILVLPLLILCGCSTLDSDGVREIVTQVGEQVLVPGLVAAIAVEADAPEAAEAFRAIVQDETLSEEEVEAKLEAALAEWEEGHNDGIPLSPGYRDMLLAAAGIAAYQWRNRTRKQQLETTA